MAFPNPPRWAIAASRAPSQMAGLPVEQLTGGSLETLAPWDTRP